MLKKITSRTITGLKPPQARTEIRDAVLKGFGLRYWQSKTDPRRVDGSWFIHYKRGGIAKRQTIGSLSIYTLAEARDIARDMFQRVDRGEPPQIQAPATSATIGTLIAEFDLRYLQEHRKDAVKPRRVLEVHLIEAAPSWKNRPLKDVTVGDIHAKLDQLKDENKNYAANRLLEVIRTMFKYAVQRGYLDVSPAERITRPTVEKPRRRVLDDDEIKSMWAAFDDLGYPVAPFFQLLLLTGQRSGEVSGMSWAEIDLDNATWNLPAERTKSDRSHAVPLSPWAVEILEACPRFTSSDHVLVGRGTTTGHIGRNWKSFDSARQAAGVDNWRPHDLRRTLRTKLGEIGTPPHIAELVLNHTVKGLQAVYDRYEYTKEKREALEKWAAHLKAITEGKQNVVALR